jgi:hypothetical protein
MRDELDPLLLRAFAECEPPLPDADFLARVSAQLHGRPALPDLARALPAALAAALHGVAAGVTVPLRLRYAGVVALAAALVTFWSLLAALA